MKSDWMGFGSSNRATIITIGSELLSGSVLNTNSAFLSKELSRHFFEILAHATVKDDPHEISKTLRYYLHDSDLIVITGGLGPTFDDVTKQTLAIFFNRSMAFNAAQFTQIKKYFRSRKRGVDSSARQQACFPKSCHVLTNNYGVAPGLALESDGKWIIALPGVPSEMAGMFHDEVVPFLKKTFRPREVRTSIDVKMIGLNEVEALKRMGRDFPPQDPTIECGIYPSAGEVLLRLKLRGETKEQIWARANFWKKVFMRKLGRFIVGFTDEPFEKTVGDLLRKKRQTLAVAESLTGGLLAKRLTDVAGASRFLRGGVIAYSNLAKRNTLGIDSDRLIKYSAVSKQIACDMANQVRIKFDASLGLATTGVAGPTKGQSDRPVGTVFIGVSSHRKTSAYEYRFFGGREKVRWLASQTALALLRGKILRQGTGSASLRRATCPRHETVGRYCCRPTRQARADGSGLPGRAADGGVSKLARGALRCG